jgi:hypothetical protein
MLRKITASSAIAVLLSAAVAQATVIEVPLPGLLGDYPLSLSNGTRTVTVVLPQAPSAIHGASFRVSGTTMVGQADCEESGGLLPFPMSVEAYMYADTPANVWYASDHSVGTVSGAFSWTAQFRPTPPTTTTWSFFMDGVADISLDGSDPFTWCNVLVHPTSHITEAVLILDADFPVAVQPSTWGRIKSLYR